jgi:hypothetical protein
MTLGKQTQENTSLVVFTIISAGPGSQNTNNFIPYARKYIIITHLKVIKKKNLYKLQKHKGIA